MKKIGTFIASIAAAILISTLISLTASAAQTGYYGSISSGETKWGNFSSSWGGDIYVFTPSVTGEYTFYSSNNTGDPCFYLVSPAYYSTVKSSIESYGSKNETARNYSLGNNDDYNGSNNFQLSYLCYAGQTYYCFMTKYNTGVTSYNFTVNGPYYSSVSLNRNGGSGGSGMFYTRSGNAWLSGNSGSVTNSIAPPTQTGYTFTGYFNAASGGIQYIASNGVLINSAANLSGITLYAQWSQNVYTLTFNNQGVANTTKTISYGVSIPGNAPVPTRTGYQFNGYYAAAIGGTQYYNSNGTRSTNLTMTGNNTLYAQWSIKSYTISYTGMEGASISPQPKTHTYNMATTIPNPSKTDYTFMGWTVNSSTAQKKNLTLGGTGYTANITLKANWVKTISSTVEDPNAMLENEDASVGDLNKIFENPVSESDKGVTSDELNNSSAVQLTLRAENVNGTIDGEEDIKKATNGEVIKFFDVKVIKTVTASDGSESETNLSEVPETVQIRIPLSGDLVGKSSYQVLRYHKYVGEKGDVDTQVHKLDEGSRNGEHYIIENGALVIHTRMFSTFAIAAGQTELGLTQTTGDNKDDSAGFDVQGRISQAKIDAVYKIDVSWGNMLFEYNTAKEWDPNNHIYQGESYSWANKSFQGGNNEIKLANHSNGDVNVDFTFARETSQLEGVDVVFKEVNSEMAAAVTKYFLGKVPMEGEAAPTIQSYLWLSGTPTTMPGGTPSAGGESAITKVGVITATISAVDNTTLTPRNN